MMKKVLLLSFIIFSAVTGSFAQQKPLEKPVGNEKTSPTYTQDIMYYYMQKSVNVVVPDSVLTMMKEHGFRNGIDEKTALKVSTYLRPVFNENLSPAERIEACKIEMAIPAWQQVIPQYFFVNTIQRLEQIH